MSILNIPVWTVPPDWADPVIETLSWLTGVMTSTTGVEQRQRLRLSPRRLFEYTIRADGVWRTYTDNLLSTVFQVSFYLPIWHECANLTEDQTAGDGVITVKGNRTEMKAAKTLFIQGAMPWSFELVEVTSVSVVDGDMVFVLVDDILNDWDAGTLVYPVAEAMLSEQPTVNRLSDDAWELPVKFQLNQSNDWPLDGDLPGYRGFVVLDLPANYGDEQSGSYFRYNPTLDAQTGLVFRRDVGGLGFNGFTVSNFVVARDAADTFRTLLYYMRGRLSPVWLVFPSSDFSLALPAIPEASGIVVERCGFTDLGGPTTGRKDIRILLRDGTAIYRRITSSTIRDDGKTELLALDSSPTHYLSRHTVVQISFMAVGRLDQDDIELTHTTDVDGITNCALVTKSVPDARVAEDWTPEPFPPGTPGDCGPTGPTRFYVRRNGGAWNGGRGANPSTNNGGINISGLPLPLYPLLGFNTGFFGEQIVTAQFNDTDQFFGGGFAHTIPQWASPWDNETAWSGVDKGDGITVVDDVIAFAGGEITGQYVRATKTTAVAPGLRYWELAITQLPQNVFIGFADAAFGLNSEGTGNYVTVRDNGNVSVNGVTVSDVNIGLFEEGDVIGIAIYTEV